CLLHLLTTFSIFVNAPSTPHFSTLSLHDALPICCCASPTCATLPGRSQPGAFRRTTRGETPYRLPVLVVSARCVRQQSARARPRSEEHTSELQSPYDLVCRLLLEKKKKK